VNSIFSGFASRSSTTFLWILEPSTIHPEFLHVSLVFCGSIGSANASSFIWLGSYLGCQ
jgi:hypothetical protein